MSARAGLAQALARTNALRRGLGAEHAASGRHKEWFHVCLELEKETILCNFSLMERGQRDPAARVALLWRGERWQGDVFGVPLSECTAQAGSLDLGFGENRFWQEGAELCLRVVSPRGDRVLEARLTPLSPPTLPSSIRLGPGAAMHWVVVPRLSARGSVRVNGQVRHFADAIAYHDHNWGDFSWGHGFRWDWGYVCPPDSPWALVVVRVSDGPGHRTLSQGVLVWRDDVQVRTFQDAEIVVAQQGSLRQHIVHQIPPVLRLAAPGSASGVPAETVWRAQGRQDALEIRFRARDHAQVLIPSDDDPSGLTRLNEVYGRYLITGRIAGEPIALDHAGVLEHVRHG